MKSLKTIQVLAKIGKIVSKIIFIFCIVGFCGCIVGAVGLAIGMQTLQLGDTTLRGLLEMEAGLSEGTLYASMAAGAIFCAGEAVLARFAVHYFDRELADGTPFVYEGARELQRLGILAICIPLGAQILAQIVRAVFAQVMTGVGELELEQAGAVSVGIMLIVMAQLCKYGAELAQGRDA